MQQEFVILTLETSLKDKKIIVTTNNKIDPNSIDDIHVEIMERESRGQVSFTTEIIGNNLEVTLTQWPVPNSTYIFYLKSLTNVLGESTTSGIRRKVTFDSAIVKEVDIISPSMHELLKSLEVKYKIFNKTEIEDDENNPIEENVYIEVSTDNAFINIAKSTETSNKDSVTITGLSNGQYFIRARLQVDSSNSKFQYGKWSETTSFVFGKETCKPEQEEDKDDDYTPEYDDEVEDDDMLPDIDDVADFEIECITPQCRLPKEIVFTVNKELHVEMNHASQVLILADGVPVNKEVRFIDKMILVSFEQELDANKTYDFKFIKIESMSGDKLTANIKYVTRLKPMYVELEAVTSLIGDFKISTDVILYHIREASKFADYVLSASGSMGIKDENDIPFEVRQLVKYYAAHECLLRHTVDLASQAGLKGTVGNVTFEERETTRDISKLLQHFCQEIDKWKDAVRGYELEGRAKMQTTIRGKNASPLMQPMSLDNIMRLGRGDL